MPYIDWEEFWWNNITGANTVVEQVATGLSDHKIVVLQIPSDLPWRNYMRSSIQSAFRERNVAADAVFEFIDAEDEMGQEYALPGPFILDHYADLTVKTGYRDKSRMTIQEYIVSHEVIRNRIIWVKGLSSQAAGEWIQFCRDFSPKSVEDGLFVLEVPQTTSVPNSRYFDCIDYEKYVSSYDVQLFCSFILKGTSADSDIWKKYISTVTASVCGTDAELSERLLDEVDFHIESIMDGIRRIMDEGSFDRRGAAERSSHILAYYRRGQLDEIQRRIWNAQVQVLFPIIEMERVRLVNKWDEEIRAALESRCILQYNEQITNPSDVELGTLCYMMSHKDSNNYYLLYIPEDTDRDRIRFLHECRNIIAHVSICTPEQIATILDYQV